VTPFETGPVVAYTLLHFGVFALFGVLVTQLAHLAMTSPLARFALMMLAVVFEVFFFVETFALFTGTSSLFPWWSVLAANTLSLIAMGLYLRSRHPGLQHQYQREPLGA
jgi:predicted tellurium resistance membrane protein TerC